MVISLCGSWIANKCSVCSLCAETGLDGSHSRMQPSVGRSSPILRPDLHSHFFFYHRCHNSFLSSALTAAPGRSWSELTWASSAAKVESCRAAIGASFTSTPGHNRSRAARDNLSLCSHSPSVKQLSGLQKEREKKSSRLQCITWGLPLFKMQDKVGNSVCICD